MRWLLLFLHPWRVRESQFGAVPYSISFSPLESAVIPDVESLLEGLWKPSRSSLFNWFTSIPLT